MSELDNFVTRVGIKGNVRYITISDNIPEHWDNLIDIAQHLYTSYWYIFHDSDDTDKHIHLVCYDKAGTTLKGHCERFSSVVPSNFVNKVKSGRAICRYLIHLDDPQKFQYSPDNVVTNDRIKFDSFIHDSSDSLSEFDDFLRVKKGELSPKEFLEKYQFNVVGMNFYQRINLYDKLNKII